MEPETILAEIDAFCAEHGIAPTTFGSLALNDRGLVAGLRKGRDCRLSTATKILAFISNYRAEQAQA